MRAFKARKLVPLSIALLAPVRIWAQRLEVGAQGGYFLPAIDQFQRDVIQQTSTGFVTSHYDGRHNPGFAIGLNVTAWPLVHLGLDLAGAVRFGDRSGSSPFVINPFLPVPAGDRAVLSSLALRLLGRVRIGGTALRLGVGPALIHIGGSAYDGGTAEITLAKRTLPGATVLGDITHLVGGFHVRLGVEDALYQVIMASLPPGATTRTPLQHDLTLTAGIVLRVH